jgi:phage terminase large subunit
VPVEPFRGSGAVHDPGGRDGPEAQEQGLVRELQGASLVGVAHPLQQNTFRAVVEGMDVSPDDLISIAGTLPELSALIAELSQPTYTINSAGKVVVDKAPEGTRSPNLPTP